MTSLVDTTRLLPKPMLTYRETKSNKETVVQIDHISTIWEIGKVIPTTLPARCLELSSYQERYFTEGHTCLPSQWYASNFTVCDLFQSHHVLATDEKHTFADVTFTVIFLGEIHIVASFVTMIPPFL